VLAVRERGGVRIERRERRADANVDAALDELPRRVAAEAGRELREDLRSCVDEDPALVFVGELGVVAERVAD